MGRFVVHRHAHIYPERRVDCINFIYQHYLVTVAGRNPVQGHSAEVIDKDTPGQFKASKTDESKLAYLAGICHRSLMVPAAYVGNDGFFAFISIRLFP